MKGRKKIGTVLLVGISMLICLSGLSAAAEKVEQVIVGLNMELTGGLASWTIPPSYGFLDYYSYLNEQGGFAYKDPTDKKVHKARYKILWADNGFSVARSLTNVKRFIDEGAKIILTA